MKEILKNQKKKLNKKRMCNKDIKEENVKN